MKPTDIILNTGPGKFTQTTHRNTTLVQATHERLPFLQTLEMTVRRYVDSGTWVRRHARPYVSYARVLMTPVIVSLQVTVGAGEYRISCLIVAYRPRTFLIIWV
jgi:hypothetical protein